MSDLTHDLIHIAVGHLLPKPKKYAWVSAVESGPYHIETNDSAANGGQGFKAICGAAGDFNFHLTGSQIFPSQKCKTCVESSTANILDVAPQRVAGVSGVHTEGQLPTPSASVPVSAFKPDAIAHGLMLSADTNAAPSADFQFHEGLLIEGLIGSVIRAEEHDAELEQLSAEGNDAAEEGALIDASGYQRPEYERNGR